MVILNCISEYAFREPLLFRNQIFIQLVGIEQLHVVGMRQNRLIVYVHISQLQKLSKCQLNE